MSDQVHRRRVMGDYSAAIERYGAEVCSLKAMDKPKHSAPAHLYCCCAPAFAEVAKT